jgi:hypothetical protein
VTSRHQEGEFMQNRPPERQSLCERETPQTPDPSNQITRQESQVSSPQGGNESSKKIALFLLLSAVAKVVYQGTPLSAVELAFIVWALGLVMRQKDK